MSYIHRALYLSGHNSKNCLSIIFRAYILRMYYIYESYILSEDNDWWQINDLTVRLNITEAFWHCLIPAICRPGRYYSPKPKLPEFSRPTVLARRKAFCEIYIQFLGLHIEQDFRWFGQQRMLNPLLKPYVWL